MKILQVKQAVHEITADLDKALEVPESEPLQVRYNRLVRELHRTKQRLHMLEFPQRSDEELERDMLSVRQFVSTMTAEQGIVTCANLYNKEFFDVDKDRRFVVKLCIYLVESFRKASILCESQFRLWEHYANGGH